MRCEERLFLGKENGAFLAQAYLLYVEHKKVLDDAALEKDGKQIAKPNEKCRPF